VQEVLNPSRQLSPVKKGQSSSLQKDNVGWAKHRSKNRWASIGPKRLGQTRPSILFFILGTGWTRPSQLGWARTGPARSNLVTSSPVTKLHETVQREL